MTEQEKREKVLKGLEYCTAPGNNCDMRCLYYNVDDCEVRLKRDAFDMLKEQDARVMSLDEVAALTDGSIVWLEDHDKQDVIAGLLRDVIITASNERVVVLIHFAIVRNQLIEIVTAMAEDYGIRWRCWTSRPDQATREATPWE